MSSPQLEVRMPGLGPRFLRLTVAERNGRLAACASAKEPSFAGTLRLSDDSLVVNHPGAVRVTSAARSVGG